MKYTGIAALALVTAGPLAAQAPTTSAVVPSVAPANSDVSRYYDASRNAPIWFRAGQGEAVPQLISILRRSPVDGFTRGPQLAAEVETAFAAARTGDAKAVQHAERVMSSAWVAYVQTISAPTPGMIYGEKWVTPVTPTTFGILSKALNAPSLAQHLKSVSDINPVYAGLRDKAVEESQLPGGGNAARYMANMERARSIPAKGRFVLVDAATARLWLYEDGRPVDSMKVVVGDKDKLGLPTPMIASVIWYTTFNPYWHVPDHLARKSAARVVKEGEAYLKRSGYQVVDSWSKDAKVLPASSVDWKAVAAGTASVKLRQLPGGNNSMGDMKFNFANPEGIYLHDTPTREHFAKSQRTISNGCIRVEDAKRLARWLLQRDASAPTKDAEQHVVLPQGVPVYVTYLTAQPHLGEVALAKDVYGWDARSTSSAAVAAKAGAGS
ncbi:L,D-transpeptidase family protein [Sphingomonas xanthus]|uniref:L,D-transpeptidase family protein n=1 Tax=Sphingomonas xanthus TaxID=2594473 RepID=A0A516ITP3_9SPHN|nr:L,D-transpeptidase family protein [Sphingomonas xanthus]QDP20184.1 L,D-transpeptidase family protein [Sphingomonas xanthus]